MHVTIHWDSASKNQAFVGSLRSSNRESYVNSKLLVKRYKWGCHLTQNPGCRSPYVRTKVRTNVPTYESTKMIKL